MCRGVMVSTTPVPKSKTRALASLGVNALRLGTSDARWRHQAVAGAGDRPGAVEAELSGPAMT
jgi:hypothetical protein